MENQTRKWKQVGIFSSFEEADSLRKELEDKGVIIKDKQDKTTWKYK